MNVSLTNFCPLDLANGFRESSLSSPEMGGKVHEYFTLTTSPTRTADPVPSWTTLLETPSGSTTADGAEKSFRCLVAKGACLLLHSDGAKNPELVGTNVEATAKTRNKTDFNINKWLCWRCRPFVVIPNGPNVYQQIKLRRKDTIIPYWYCTTTKLLDASA